MENHEHIELIKKLEEYFTEHYLDITADWGHEIASHERKFQVCCSANERIKILVFGYMIWHKGKLFVEKEKLGDLGKLGKENKKLYK